MSEWLPGNIDKAKYSLVHDYKGGAAALAPLISIKNSSVLSNKVNPNMDSHHLTVDESVALQAITRDFKLLKAEAAVLGHAVIKLPDPDETASDMAILDCWAAWQQDCGETAGAIRQALENGEVDKEELEEIRREVYEDFSRELELLQQLEQLVRE